MIIDAFYRAPQAWVDRDADGVLPPALSVINWQPPPGLEQPASRRQGAFKLIHAQLQIDKDDPQLVGKINNAVPGQCLGALGDFDPVTNLREQIIPMDTATIMSYQADIIISDPDTGQIIGTERPTNLMHEFAGYPLVY
jgi:hypothetical protein